MYKSINEANEIERPTNQRCIENVIIHFLLKIIIINRSNKTRSLLRDKYKVVYSDRHYSLVSW